MLGKQIKANVAGSVSWQSVFAGVALAYTAFSSRTRAHLALALLLFLAMH